MAQPRLIITKEKDTSNKPTKSVFIDAEVLEGVKAIKEETGKTIQYIIEKFIRYGIDNVEVIEEE